MLTWARRFSSFGTKKGIDSHVSLGTRYEASCQELLRTIGMNTRHMGGPNDGGVDLRGWWHLFSWDNSNNKDAVSVIVQCKYISRDCPPIFIRELEGTLSRWPGSIGILLASTPATKSCLAALLESPLSLMFLFYDMVKLRKAIGNAALHRQLPNLVIGSRHVGGEVQPVFFVRE